MAIHNHSYLIDLVHLGSRSRADLKNLDFGVVIPFQYMGVSKNRGKTPQMDGL